MELTTEEAFKYGTTVATGAYGMYVAIRRIVKVRNKGKDRCSNCNLCRHKLFAILEIWLKEKDTARWNCCNEYKTAVARKLVEIKLNAGISDIKSFVCRLDKNVDAEYVKQEFGIMIKTMMVNYENAWLAAGINPMIVQRISAYHNLNATKAITRFNHEIDCDFKPMTERLHLALDTMISPYNDFMYDVRLVLNGVNGELKGDVFSGIENDGKRIKVDISLLAASKEDIVL